MTPVKAKLHRHPVWISTIPISGTPMAEANFAAASKSEVAKLRSRAGNQRPMAFALAGNARRFALAQQEARAEEAAQTGRDRSRERCRAPEKRAHASHAPHAKFVEDDADGKLAGGVGPVI